MTVADLSRVYPSIPWLEYMNKILAPFVHVDEREVVNVKEPKFVTELERLLAVTPRRVQANYALWRVVRDSVDYLNEEIRKRQLAYWTEVTGETEREPRWVGAISGVYTIERGNYNEGERVFDFVFVLQKCVITLTVIGAWAGSMLLLALERGRKIEKLREIVDWKMIITFLFDFDEIVVIIVMTVHKL